MKSYGSIYLGIVIQNNDPEYRGRVKIWVPHINASVYDKWNQTLVDRKFKFPGKNIDSDLSLVISELRDILPWADQCTSVVGESSSARYNAFEDTASLSDAVYSHSLSGSNTTNTAPSYTLNPDKMGEKPGSVYEKYGTRLTDAFTDTTATHSNSVNPNGAEYRPSTYSNAAKGLFSVPNVGAHVWVLFRDGSPLFPLYMGTTFSTDDYNSIFQSEDDIRQDYPQAFENKSSLLVDKDVNTSTYRNKLVLNQRGAAIEIINTTDRERLKLTHFAGGFIEFNNQYNSLFSPKNLQLLTQKDKFETVRGNSNTFVGRDSDNIIQGNYHLKIGNLNKEALDEWVSAYTAIADILALPEGAGDKDSLASVVEAQASALAAAEAKLGFGGNYIETITKHKFLNVGLIFNEVASTRYHNTQKAVTRFRNVTSGGTEATTKEIPYIEYTHVDDMPGGNYTQSIGNRWNVLVGAGGIDVKTTGPINIGGTILAIGAKQVNISSLEDTNIDGGTNLSIIADIMSIRSRNRDQVIVDDNLGISKNVVIGGGLYANGEVFVQHITAPVEYQLSEKSTITAGTGKWSIAGATITKVSGSGPIQSGDAVNISGGTLDISQTHQHFYKNIPLTLLENAAAVRSAAQALNGGSAAASASAVSDGYKSNPGSRTPPTDPRNN